MFRENTPAWVRLMLIVWMVASCRAWAVEDSRLDELGAQIEATKALIKASTNDAERAQWEQRLAILHQDRSNAIRRIEIEQREKELMSSLKRRADRALQDDLRLVDTDIAIPQSEARRLDQEMRTLRTTRQDFENRLSLLRKSPEQNAERITDFEMRLRNLEEEIAARTYQRDVADLRIRLAGEAQRIEKWFSNLPLFSAPRLRDLLHKYAYRREEQRRQREATMLMDLVSQRLNEAHSALALSREKFAQSDTQLGLLEKSRLLGDRRADYRQAYYLLSAEKKLLQQRIQNQEEQVAALQEAVSLWEQLRDLYGKELAVIEIDLDTAKQLYLRWLAWPVGAVLGWLAVRFILNRAVLPVFLRKENLFVARRLVAYLTVIGILITLAFFFLEDLKQIATVLGIASAAVVIALQDLCSSIAGWFIIVMGRKFGIGDRVEVDGQVGDVVDIQLLRTTLVEINNWLGADEPTGRVILIPNHFVFRNKVFNFSHVHPYVWHKVDVLVTFETPPEEAEALLTRILQEETRENFEEARHAAQRMEYKYGSAETAYEPKVRTFIEDSGVLFRLIYVTHHRKAGATRDRLNRRILAEFEKDKRMQFAYPTERHIPTPEPPGFPVVTKPG